MSDVFRVTTIHRGICTIVAVCGEVDMATAPELGAELVDIDGDVHLDCHHVTFLSSSGIAVLLQTHERCQANGHQLVIHGLSPFARRTLQIMGIDRVLNVAGTTSDRVATR